MLGGGSVLPRLKGGALVAPRRLGVELFSPEGQGLGKPATAADFATDGDIAQPAQMPCARQQRPLDASAGTRGVAQELLDVPGRGGDLELAAQRKGRSSSTGKGASARAAAQRRASPVSESLSPHGGGGAPARRAGRGLPPRKAGRASGAMTSRACCASRSLRP